MKREDLVLKKLILHFKFIFRHTSFDLMKTLSLKCRLLIVFIVWVFCYWGHQLKLFLLRLKVTRRLFMVWIMVVRLSNRSLCLRTLMVRLHRITSIQDVKAPSETSLMHLINIAILTWRHSALVTDEELLKIMSPLNFNILRRIVRLINKILLIERSLCLVVRTKLLQLVVSNLSLTLLSRCGDIGYCVAQWECCRIICPTRI